MDQPTTARIEDKLAALWQRGIPTLIERLDLLDRTAATAANGSLTHDAQLEARNIAHKLAGTLGMFGYAEGTVVARKLELLLSEPLTDPSQLRPLAASLRQSIFPAS
jgi:Hpt domain